MSQAVAEVTHPAPGSAMPAAVPPKTHQEKKTWTANDLLALAGDKNRYEIVRGRLTMMTPASTRHGKYAMRVGSAIATFVNEHEVGEVYAAETGFQLEAEPLTIRAPDVAFVRREYIPPAGEPEGFWAIAPDLVVEIVSPSETAEEVYEKVADYLRAGTQLLWLVYPTSRTAMEYRPPMQARRLTIEDNLDGGEVVPGFCYPLKRLFV